MTSSSGAGQDHVLGGYKPRRIHDPKWGIAGRPVGYSFLAEYPSDADAIKGLDAYLRPAERAWYNIADDQSWFLWKSRDQGSRPISSFSTSFSSIASGGGLLPQRQQGQADGRYETINMPGDVSFPGGWTGIVSAGMEEFSQQACWHPDFLGIVCPNKAGNWRHGTWVYDLDAQDNLDPNRRTRFHRMFSVLDLDPGFCGIKGDVLAINLGPGGKLDFKTSYMPFVDYRNGRVGIGDQLAGGGPFVIDPGFCIHNLGSDKDGRKIVPLHLSTKALFLAPYGDAPLDFEPTAWIPTAQDYGGIWKQVHLRLNTEVGHSAACNARPGRWQWQVQIPLAIIPPPWIPDPPPPPPPPPDPPPLDDPRPPRPPTGGDPPPGGGVLLPGGGIFFPGVDEDVEIRLPGQPEETFFPGLNEDVPVRTGTDETFFPGLNEDVPVRPHTNNQEGSYPPNHAYATNCVYVPNLGFPAYPTNGTSVAIGDNTIDAETFKKYTRSPHVAQFRASAKGTGSLTGFNQIIQNGVAHSDGVLSLLPDSAYWISVINGDYDPTVHSSPRVAPTTVWQAMPPGLVNGIAFAHPKQDSTTILGAGPRIEADSGTELTVTFYDGSNAQSGSQFKVTSSDVTYGGTSLVSSTANAIGGSGADGAITRSANTQEGSVVNATTYTLDASYTAYSAVNRPLVIKTTGTRTINGTLGRNGAGALEPA